MMESRFEGRERPTLKNFAPRFLREHPLLTRALALGFTALLCCFAFPLGTTAPPLELTVMVILLSLCLAEAFGPGRERGVFLRTLAAAGVGLLGRYLLEYGEVSNARNFTPENVLTFLFAVPVVMTAVYHFLGKQSAEASEKA